MQRRVLVDGRDTGVAEEVSHASGDTQDVDGWVAELVQPLASDLQQLTRRVDDHEGQILDTLESLAAELDTRSS